MLTTLLFALEIKFRGGKKHSTTSRVSPYTSFVLYPLPACFITEQSTVKASLFVK